MAVCIVECCGAVFTMRCRRAKLQDLGKEEDRHCHARGRVYVSVSKCVCVCVGVCVVHQCQGFVWCCERCHCHFGAHSMVPHLHTSPSSNFTLLSIRFIRLFRSFVRSFVLACLRIRYASFPFVLIFSAWIWIHSFLLRVLCMSALTACTDYIFASTTNTVSSFIACVDGSVFPGFLPPPNPLPPPSSPLLRHSVNH